MEARAEKLILILCPSCERDLAPSDFGICRARSSGRNLYCKKCIREKVTRTRSAARARKAAAVAQLPLPPAPDLRLLRGPRSLRLVRAQFPQPGTRQSFEALVKNTRLTKDQVGEALTQLLLWDRELETKIDEDNGARFYQLRTQRAGAGGGRGESNG